MGKRRRNSDDHVADFGLGATMARLREESRADINPATAVNQDDDDGWTTVGAPKKKRKQLEHRPESGISPYIHSNGDGLLLKTQPKDSMSKAEEHNGEPHNDQSIDSTTRIVNPFSAQKVNAGERVPALANPFSTRDQSNSEQTKRSPKRSPPARSGSEERRQAKVERGKRRKLERNYPAIEHSRHARLQSHVKIHDLQSLVLYLLADGTAPQWVSVQNRGNISHVVVLMVPGLELGMFNGDIPLEPVTVDVPQNEDGGKAIDPPLDANESTSRSKRLHISPDEFYPASLKPHRLPAALKPLCDIFPHVWPILGAGEHRMNQYYKIHSPIHTMLTSQIPKSQEEKQMKKHHKGPLPQTTKHFENKRTPITQYTATLVEQQENEYVVHPAWFTTPEAKEAAYQRRKEAHQTSDDGWVDTNVTSLQDGDVPEKGIEQGSVTAGRRILTVDCEMCRAEDEVLVLTRASLLDWDGNVVLDRLVKPDVPIKDYLTQYSGITPAMLENVTTTLSDIQKEMLELLTPHTILLGHSLNSDLNALKLTHPFLVDTAILYPHARGPPYKQSLKWLSTKYLSKDIQKGGKGHDSVEDALACLDLVKQKCERGPRWGTSETNAESIFRRLGRATRPKAGKAWRAGAVVDWGDPTRGHGGQAQVAIGCKSDRDVIEGIELAVKGLAQGKIGVTEQVDYIWGRFRELELIRGWWDDAKSVDVEAIRQAALERLGRPVSEGGEETNVTTAELGEAVARTVNNIAKVFDSLPPGTAFIVYSGTGDPREIRRLQAMRQQHQREYQTKNWDNLSVKWTDTEVQALSRACQSAREGIGFVVVK